MELLRLRQTVERVEKRLRAMEKGKARAEDSDDSDGSGNGSKDWSGWGS